MLELSDALIALPGGLGTLEELFEALSWSQMNLHNKPIGLLNINGYYNKLIQFLFSSSKSGFLYKKHLALLNSSSEPEELLNMLIKRNDN